jgi:ubiquinone/menaquinone biosynthesis C-methylase UbiE
MNVDYTEISKTYDRYRSYPQSLIENIIDFGEIKEGMRVLDLGCGTGNVASQLLGLLKVNLIGIDQSIPMLEVAREKSLDVICADADSNPLPFQDSSFDIIIAAYVIHHITNPKLLISDCYRVLREGTLLILTSSHNQIEHQHPVIRQFFPTCIETDKNRFPDLAEIEYLLRSAGFQDIKQTELLVGNIPIDEEYLEKVKGKYVSTYRLLPQSEFELGVSKLEAFLKSRGRHESREWRCTLIRGRKNA